MPRNGSPLPPEERVYRDFVTNVRTLVIAGGALSMLVVATPAQALGSAHQRTERATVAGPVTALSVRGEVGTITIVPGPVTRVVAVEQYNLQAPSLAHSLRDGLLRVSAPCPRPTGILELGLNNCSVDFVITVPRAVKVDARNSVGDIRVHDLRGAQTLHTDVGDVLADHVAASTLIASSDTGTVRLADVRAGSVTLRSSSGKLVATLAAMPRTVVARNSDGDVDLRLPTGTYAVDLHTDVGDTHVRGITNRSDARRTLTARTSAGDIRIVGR